MEPARKSPARVVGRYAIYDVIATGGMATVHLSRLIGPIGFSRTVAIKRLHAQFATDPEFTEMFLDEARVASRIRHPNVVPVIDVVAEDGELLLVMEYVHGESLSFLLRAHPERTPERMRIVANIVAGALHGLHAAHETTGDGERPLGIVHRDVSPQNVLLGVDGIPRVLDFGVAKAAGQLHCTGTGRVKGKIRYLAPELIKHSGLDRRADIWSASVMLWESLSGQRLFTGETDLEVMQKVLEAPIRPLREVSPDVPAPLARVIERGLMRDPSQRFATAIEMASALEEAVGLVGPREVGAWVEKAAHKRLEARRHLLTEIEGGEVVAAAGPGRVGAALVALLPVAGVAAQERTSMHVVPRRPGWVVPLSAGVVLVATVVAVAAHESGPSSAAVAVASAPVAASAPVQAARAPVVPVAAAVPAQTAVVEAASASVSAAPTPAVQRGVRTVGPAQGARPAASAGSPDFRVPLYGRD